jgi:hypothetical protein
MANLIPYTKSSIIKSKKSAIIKADKFLNAKTKSTKVNENSVKPKQSKNSSEDIILQIEKKVIKIDKLLKDSFALKTNQQKKSTIKEEQKEFENREKELEKKKPKKEPGINLPTLPKMGFIDWIKNFVFNTILGFLAVRLIKFLPTLLKIYPVIIGAGEFLINVGGNLLNSLVSFVDWGYKAVDATSGFIKSIGGEGLSKVFDNFTGAVDNVLEFAVMAALISSGGDDESGGLGGKGGRKGFDSQGRRVGKNVQQRYERRFGKDKFVDRFGTKNLKNVAQGARRGAFQQGTRNAFVGLAGKGGAKSILKFVRPLTNKLPIIGGLLNFGLSVALGEDPGRAAFKAIGSTLVGALGAAIGSLAFGVGGIIGGIIGGIGGDALGGALYDMFFNGKKPTQKQGKTNKLAGGGSPIPPTRGGKSSSSTPKRTLKKKKSTKTLTFNPRKIHPGRSAGGEAKVQSVFPNPEKKAWWDPLGVFTGKKQEQQPQQKKPKGKIANPQEFLIKSNEVLGRSKSFGGFSTLIIKTLLGDTPDELDYLNSARGLNSFMQGIFQPGTLGFSGGGEVDAREFFQGADYTKIIAKSVKDSVSKEVDTTIRNLRNEMSLKSASKDSEDHDDMGGGGGGGGGGGSGYDDSPHGTPGPAVQATSGFNPGKGDKTRKIFLHWTASDHSKNFNNYHTTFLGNGRAVRNRGYGVDGTEHTAGANTNSVGLSIAAMGGDGVNENKFGSFPPTSAQVSAMALEAARLAVAWGWDESTIEKNVRTHGEWERYATKSGILRGAPQRWDLDKLRQSDPMNSGGDKLRKMIKSYFKKLKAGATVDSSGKVISKTTGSPLAQMSLETAMEMTGSVSGGTNVSGGNADFWTLAAVASLESTNPQGQADVAQAVYNRVASRANFGQGGNHTIKGHILAQEQFQPVRETRGGYDTWSKITDKTTAIAALSAHDRGRNAAKMIESSAANIRNAQLRKNSAEFVGGRTDFATAAAANKYPGGFGYKERHGHLYGWYVGPGSIAYGKKNPSPAQAPNLGNISVSSTDSGGQGGSISGSGNIQYLGKSGTFIQGNTGNSDGEHFHIGPTELYDPQTDSYPDKKTERGKRDAREGAFQIAKALTKSKTTFAMTNHSPYYYVNPSKPPSDSELISKISTEQSNHMSRGRGGSWGGIDFSAIPSNARLPLAVGKISTRGGGFGNAARVMGTNAFVAHGASGSRGSRFHGGEITTEGAYNLHKGEVVIDFDTRKLFGIDLLMDLNSVENKTQLIAKVPSIIEKLKSISGISGYPYYGNPNQEPQYIIIQSPPKIVYVPTGSSGRNVFISGGSIDNRNNGIAAILQV